jgi:predicted RNase H-like nuclease (RuvC/YqgF family)
MKKFTLLLAIIFGFNQMIAAQDNFWGTISGWVKPAVAFISFSAFTYILCDHFTYTDKLEKCAHKQAQTITKLKANNTSLKEKVKSLSFQNKLLNHKYMQSQFKVNDLIFAIKQSNAIKQSKRNCFTRELNALDSSMNALNAFKKDIITENIELKKTKNELENINKVLDQLKQGLK